MPASHWTAPPPMTAAILGPDPLETLVDAALRQLSEGVPPSTMEVERVDVKEEPDRRGARRASFDLAPRPTRRPLTTWPAKWPAWPTRPAAVPCHRRRLRRRPEDRNGTQHRVAAAPDMGADLREAHDRGARREHRRLSGAGAEQRRGAQSSHVPRQAAVARRTQLRGGRSGRLAVEDAAAARLRLVRSALGPHAGRREPGGVRGGAGLSAERRQTQPPREDGDLADVGDAELLRRLNLVTDGERLTNAGSLMFVATPWPGIDYMRRDAPGGDSTTRIEAEGPLLAQVHEVERAAGYANPTTHLARGFAHTQIHAIAPRALREAIVNGVTHRDWLVHLPTTVEHVGDTLVVTSPGGFVGGVTPRQHHHPRRRAPLQEPGSGDGPPGARRARGRGGGPDGGRHAPCRQTGAGLLGGGGAPSCGWRSWEGHQIRRSSICWRTSRRRGRVPSKRSCSSTMSLAAAGSTPRLRPPVLQRPAEEAEQAISQLAEAALARHDADQAASDSSPVIVKVKGVPAAQSAAYRLSDDARERARAPCRAPRHTRGARRPDPRLEPGQGPCLLHRGRRPHRPQPSLHSQAPDKTRRGRTTQRRSPQPHRPRLLLHPHQPLDPIAQPGHKRLRSAGRRTDGALPRRGRERLRVHLLT